MANVMNKEDLGGKTITIRCVDGKEIDFCNVISLIVDKSQITLETKFKIYTFYCANIAFASITKLQGGD